MALNDEVGLEQKPSSANTEELVGSAPSRTDVGGSRRKGVRLRLLVPAAVGVVSLLVGGPLAVAQSGVLARAGGSVSAEAEAEGKAAAPPQQVAQPTEVGGIEKQVGSLAGAPAVQDGEGGEADQAGQAPDDCVNLRGALPAAERALLLRDATALLQDVQGAVAQAVGTVQQVTFAVGTVDWLLPQVGSVVGLVKCGDVLRLAPEARAAILGKVHTVVTGVVVVAGGVVHQTVGELQRLDLGVKVKAPAVKVVVVSHGPKAVVLSVSLGGGAVPHLGKVLVTVRLSDGKIVKVDLRALDVHGLLGLVHGLGVGALGSLTSLDLLKSFNLLEGLDALEGVAGLKQLVPNVSSVLAPNYTIVPPDAI
jgi:hypothetical protein